MLPDVGLMFGQFPLVARHHSLDLFGDLGIEFRGCARGLHHHVVTAGPVLDKQVERRRSRAFFDVAVDLKAPERRPVKEQLLDGSRIAVKVEDYGSVRREQIVESPLSQSVRVKTFRLQPPRP